MSGPPSQFIPLCLPTLSVHTFCSLRPCLCFAHKGITFISNIHTFGKELFNLSFRIKWLSFSHDSAQVVSLGRGWPVMYGIRQNEMKRIFPVYQHLCFISFGWFSCYIPEQIAFKVLKLQEEKFMHYNGDPVQPKEKNVSQDNEDNIFGILVCWAWEMEEKEYSQGKLSFIQGR